jgi:hypothetical protein
MHNEFFCQPGNGSVPVNFLNARSSALDDNRLQQLPNCQVHVDQPEPTGIAHPVSDSHSPDRCRTALVVEDESTVRFLITELFNDVAYMSLEAVDGQSGLQIIPPMFRLNF